MYNSWVHLGLEIFSVIIWLVCLALFASHADNLASIDAFASAFGTQYKALFNLDIKQYSQAFITATIAATAVTAAASCIAIGEEKSEERTKPLDRNLRTVGNHRVQALLTMTHWDIASRPQSYRRVKF
ncbi:Integral membrane protein [Colletotrichum asianum]